MHFDFDVIIGVAGAAESCLVYDFVSKGLGLLKSPVLWPFLSTLFS
jgi:hypothetical protein